MIEIEEVNGNDVTKENYNALMRRIDQLEKDLKENKEELKSTKDELKSTNWKLDNTIIVVP